MRLRTLSTSIIVVAALALPAAAQNEMSEVTGSIVDKDGNPIAGAEVTFWPKSNPRLKYSGKSNKKGRYSVMGLYTPQEGDRWTAEISAEGLLPVKVVVESRTVNKVLVGDVMTQELRVGSTISEFPIPRMGFARVDFTLAPADQVAKMQPGSAAPSEAPAEGQEGGEAAPADPWVEATTLARAGDLEASLPHFVEAIEEQPEALERRETYGKVLAELGRLDEALVATRQVLEQEPQRLEAYLLLSRIQVKKDDMEQALKALEQARQIAPQNLEVQQRLAHVAGELGNVDAQLAAYRAITEIAPDNAEAWMALGNAYHEMGDEKASEAAYQKVVGLDPKNAYQTYFNLGSLIMNRADRTDGDTQRAIDAFRRATEIKNDYAPAFKQLGFALLGTGDRAGARKALEDFLKIKPEGPEADQVRSLLKTL